MTSGTATLETALLNVPEVVVYRTLWFQVKLQPYVLKVPYVSLVNLNLGRESVVEIIQSDLTSHGPNGSCGPSLRAEKTGADAPGLRRTASRNRGSWRQRPLWRPGWWSC